MTAATGCSSCLNSGPDITSPFTPWSGFAGGQPGGFLYIDIVNNSSTDETFPQTPPYSFESNLNPAYPGLGICQEISYLFNGTGYSWQTISTSTVSSSGSAISFPAYNVTVDLQPGVHNYVGFECT
jgi:hypothetical protein